MLRDLATTAREVRLAAGARQIDIATRARVSHATISRFEGGGQPQSLDAIIAAYEAECGLGPRELWRRALQSSSTATE